MGEPLYLPRYGDMAARLAALHDQVACRIIAYTHQTGEWVPATRLYDHYLSLDLPPPIRHVTYRSFTKWLLDWESRGLIRRMVTTQPGSRGRALMIATNSPDADTASHSSPEVVS